MSTCVDFQCRVDTGEIGALKRTKRCVRFGFPYPQSNDRRVGIVANPQSSYRNTKLFSHIPTPPGKGGRGMPMEDGFRAKGKRALQPDDAANTRRNLFCS